MFSILKYIHPHYLYTPTVTPPQPRPPLPPQDMYDIAVKLQNKDADLQLTFNVRVDFVAASISRLRWLTEMTGGSISIQLGDDTDPSKAFLSTSDYRIIKSHISSTKVRIHIIFSAYKYCFYYWFHYCLY